MAQILGYEIEPVMMYQDMTARDLLQQRTTLSNGDTIWRYSPLVMAALEGKMAVLDGIHRVHQGTLAVLHRLVHERELQLYDGTRLLGRDRFEEARQACGNISVEAMAQRKILPIADNFRVVALAEPPNAQCLKITQNVAFEFIEFWHFPPIFVLLKLTCLVTLIDRKLQVFQKLAKMDHF